MTNSAQRRSMLTAATAAFIAMVAAVGTMHAQSSEEAFAAALDRGDRAAVGRVVRRSPVRARSRIASRWSWPLNLAAASGDPAIVRLLLAHGADPLTADAKGRTPIDIASRRTSLPILRLLLVRVRPAHRAAALAPGLATAAYDGNLPWMRTLFDLGADANMPTAFGPTALYGAVTGMRPGAFDLLLAHGGDPLRVTQERAERGTLLHAAARCDPERYDSALVARVLALGVDVRWVNRRRETPLHVAACSGNLRMMDQFLHAGVDIDALNEDEKTALEEAQEFRRFDAVRLLAERGARVDPGDTRERWGPLFAAASTGDTATVRFLLEHGANPNARAFGGSTPLWGAAFHHDEPTIRLLLAHGTDPALATHDGRTALHALMTLDATDRDTVLAALLVAHGAPVDGCDSAGITPLEGAVWSNNIQMARWLLDHGADGRRADTFGRTALHAAAIEGNIDPARFLLEHGVPPATADRGGRTPLHLAAYNGHEDVVAELLWRGSPANARDTAGQTPLHMAVMGSSEVVARLLRGGADVIATDHDGRTPLAFALDRRRWHDPKLPLDIDESIRLLREAERH